MVKEQKANYILCFHNRAAWTEEREDQLDQVELASLVVVAARMEK